MADERKSFINSLWKTVFSEGTPSYTIKEVKNSPSAREFMMENPQILDRRLAGIFGLVRPALATNKVFAMVKDPKTGIVVALDENKRVIGESLPPTKTIAGPAFGGSVRGGVLFTAQTGQALDDRNAFLEQFGGVANVIDQDSMNKIRYAAEAVELLPETSGFQNVQEYLDNLVLSAQPEKLEVEDPAENVEDE